MEFVKIRSNLCDLFIIGLKIEQWKAEANNSERQRQRMEAAYMNLQVQGTKRKSLLPNSNLVVE